MKYFPLNKIFLVLHFIPIIAMAASSQEEMETALNFNSDALRSFGIDKNVAAYFSKEARLPPGTQQVNMDINGHRNVNVTITIDPQGELCADTNWMQRAGVIIPQNLTETDDRCQTLQMLYPSAVVHFDSAQYKVFVLLPTEAIALQSPDEVSGYTTGGTGATINYSLLHNINKYNGDNDNYTSAALQSGINMGNWIIRNSTSVALSNGDHNLDNLYTYAEHTFTASKINMQAGGINLANPLLSGASLYGVQIQPDISLTPNRRNDVMVSGNVKSSQARIEIRQNKQLIYSTLAPMGPFTLTNVPVLNQSSNLDVTVIESDGSSDQFTVFSDSFRRTVTGTPNYNFAVGRVREVGAEDDEPMVLSGAWSQPVFNTYTLSTGGIVANNYYAFAGGVDFQPFTHWSTSIQLRSAVDDNHNKRGNQAAITLGADLLDNLSFSVTDTWSERGYRDLLDSTQNDDISDQPWDYGDDNKFYAYNKNELTGSLTWYHDLLGGISLSYTNNKSYYRDGDSTNTTINWSRQFKYFSTNFYYRHETGNDSEDSLNLTVYVPLGNHYSSSWVRHENNDTRIGSTLSGTFLKDSSYYVSYERSQDSGNNASGGLNTNLHYTRLGLSAGQSGSDSHYSSATLDGGIALHKDGITFSPDRIADTWAIAQLSQKQAGVQIQTPQGAAWTDWWGQAVVPVLPPYQTAIVEIDPKSLAKKTDIANATQEVKQGRYSVGSISFTVLSARRVMFQDVRFNNALLPLNSSVHTAQGNYLTSVVEEGTFFINNIENDTDTLKVILPDGKICHLQYTLPKDAPDSVVYETVQAHCL
ncbi:fimbria/pilus outer membrane usher protein [Escherichia coli]|nr:fimbria/pilus outer membrane usher protein [Escherichia coli]